MPNRVMSVLSEFSSRQEIYSIDECFLDMTGHDANLTQYEKQMRQRIQQWLGLPVSVGFAPTKTLAKLANHVAKKRAKYNGVCDLAEMTAPQQNKIFFQHCSRRGVGSGAQAERTIATRRHNKRAATTRF